MDSLIETFHIDIKLILAQVINFAIVISVLYFFAVKPLTKTMLDRTTKIEKGLLDAKEAGEKLAEVEEKKRMALNEAKKAANLIIVKAMNDAELKKKETIDKAKEEIGKIINDEKAQIQQEKAKILKEIKLDISDLIISTVEKILEKKIDAKEDGELIKKMIKK